MSIIAAHKHTHRSGCPITHNAAVATALDGKRNINSKKVTMRRDLRNKQQGSLLRSRY